MTIKVLKGYFEKRREQKRIVKQYALEKACVDYFNNCVPRIDEITELANDIPIGMKGIPLLAKFNKSSYPIQTVRACMPFKDDEIQLYYGSCPYRCNPDWFVQIKDLPSSLWFSVEEYQRPTRPAVLLCEYSSSHYEVAEYENKTWTTELCFPVKPIRYFVLDFLTKN